MGLENSHHTSVDRFREMASQERFSGWQQVGDCTTLAHIPFFGDAIKYQLRTGNGVEDYYSIIRHFGWSVAFGVTNSDEVLTLVQWKPGVNQASWELPPGGIGKIDPTATPEEILSTTQSIYLRETGYGRGNWSYLGYTLVETGKYRGAGPNSHGLAAHMFMATGLERIHDARHPNKNEIMETLVVPLGEFNQVIDSGLFNEVSALPCALLSLRRLGI